MDEHQSNNVIRGRFFNVDDRMAERSRGLFGLNFMMAIGLLVCALYFVWPLMFKNLEPHAPESVIRETYTATQLILERVRGLEHPNEETILDAIKNHPAFKGENGLWIFVIDPAGSILLSNAAPPPFWNGILLDVLSNTRDVKVVEKEDAAYFLLSDQLASGEHNLVMIKTFGSKAGSQNQSNE